MSTQASLALCAVLRRLPVYGLTNIWIDTRHGSFTDDKVYVVQTNTKVIERCLLMTTDPGDLVLDPTCGSGTTAYVAEQWGRRWITVDTSRVALALARSRLMAAKYPYYLLADSEAGSRKEAELTGQAPPADGRDRQRRPPRLRLRARAARDPQVDRPEPGHPRGHEPRGDRRRDRPPRRDRDALRPALRGPQDRARVRPVHGREPVAAPRAGRRSGGRAGGRDRAGGGCRALRDHHPRQPPPRRRAEHQARRSASRFTRLDHYPGVWIQGLGEYLEARRVARPSPWRSGPSSAPSAPS